MKEGNQGHYPDGLVKYIDYFRIKCIDYAAYDRVLCQYLEVNGQPPGRRVCSLGCGTCHHEINLVRAGYIVLGIDKDRESLERSRQNMAASGVDLPVHQADILHEAAMTSIMHEHSPFDVVTMLGLGLTIQEHGRLAESMAKYLTPGGLFVVGLFGYDLSFESSPVSQSVEVEVADGREGDFAVRLNLFQYRNDGVIPYIDWEAVYLVPGQDNLARIYRTSHPRLEVSPERPEVDPLGLAPRLFERLTTHRMVECGASLTPPHTYEYLAGWRRR